MAKRTPSQVYATLLQAGFSPDQATVMTAIAGAESGYNPAALGDQSLQNATWGPSYGLFQIRTLKGQTGSGGTRDITALASSDLTQARAAYEISQHGRDFTPWTVYDTGAYRAFLPAAQGAATEDAGPWPTWGPAWAPWNWPSDLGNAASAQAQQVLGGARHIVIETAFVILGAGLVAAGAWLAARPLDRRVRGRLVSAVAG